jgi:hypothetical protein
MPLGRSERQQTIKIWHDGGMRHNIKIANNIIFYRLGTYDLGRCEQWG